MLCCPIINFIMSKLLKHLSERSNVQRRRRVEIVAGDVSYGEGFCSQSWMQSVSASYWLISGVSYALGASVSSPVNAGIPTLKGAILSITHTPILEAYDVEQALHVDEFAFPACLSYDDGYFFRNRAIIRKDSAKWGFLPGQPHVFC